MRILLLGLVLTATPVHAEEGRTRVELTVGQSHEIEVGFAMGHLCDDESIVTSEMKNKSQDTNVLALTAKKPGTTLCRAGTYQVEDRPSFLFEIVVTAAPPPPKPPPEAAAEDEVIASARAVPSSRARRAARALHR